MPVAKRTYQNHFWSENGRRANILAQHISGAGTPAIQPGRNIADAGIARVGGFSVLTGETVTLNGLSSLFPVSFEWRVTDPWGGNVTLSNPNTATPSFVTAVDGLYQVQLNTSGDASIWQGSTLATTSVVASATAPSAATFVTAGAALSTCGGCHRNNENVVPEFAYNVHFKGFDYRLVRDRINTDRPMDSLFLQKALNNNVPHAGGKELNWLRIGSYYNTQIYEPLVRWILDGGNK